MTEQITPAVQDYLKAIHSLGGVEQIVTPIEIASRLQVKAPSVTGMLKRLEAAGRLTRPKHWQEFIPFAMAHTPLKMSIKEAHAEVNYGWSHSYGPKAIAQAVDSLDDQPFGCRVNILIARLCFRGIYFPMLGRFAWWKVIS